MLFQCQLQFVMLRLAGHSLLVVVVVVADVVDGVSAAAEVGVCVRANDHLKDAKMDGARTDWMCCCQCTRRSGCCFCCCCLSGVSGRRRRRRKPTLAVSRSDALASESSGRSCTQQQQQAAQGFCTVCAWSAAISCLLWRQSLAHTRSFTLASHSSHAQLWAGRAENLL